MMGLCLAATAIGSWLAWQGYRESQEDRFNLHSASVASACEASLLRILDVVQGFDLMFAWSERVEPGEFREACMQVQGKVPELFALEWVPVVADADREAFELGQRRSVNPGYRILDLNPSGSSTIATAAPFYWPVAYSETKNHWSGTLGWNLYTGPTREVFQMAASARRVAISEPLVPQGEQDRRPVLAFVNAIYRGGRLLGFIQGLVRVEDLFTDAVNRAHRRQLDFEVRVLRSGAYVPVFSSGAVPEGAQYSLDQFFPRLSAVSVHVVSQPAFSRFSVTNQVLAVSMCGLLLTCLVVLYFREARRRFRGVESAVQQRTRQLRDSNAALLREIDQRRRTEVELDAERARLRQLIDTIEGIVWEADGTASHYTFVSRRAESMLGHPVERWLDEPDFWQQHIHPDDRAWVAEKSAREAATREIYTLDYRMMAADGRTVWLRDMVTVGRNPDGGIRLRGVMVDVTALKEAERLLARDVQVLASVRDAIVVTDLEGVVRYWNHGAEQLYGWAATEMVGRHYFDRFPSDAVEEVRANFKRLVAGEVWNTEWLDYRKDGTRIWTALRMRRFEEAGGQPAGLIGLAHDITQQRRREEEEELLQRRLQETQKLESLGVLAGGIAHDFNNLLTGILGNASLARLQITGDSPLSTHLAQIESAAQRAAEFCRQMLAYAGKGRFEISDIDLSGLVQDLANLLHHSISKKSVLRMNLGQNMPAVRGDAAQLRQVVMNLVINASEAIGQRSGYITVSTSLVRADAGYLRTTLLANDLVPGDYVCLEVTDDGCGMDEATLRKVFEPFFTTKFSGRGLGLSAVLGIVRSHRGAMKVYSEPGRGTTFKVLLPATDHAAAQAAVLHAAPSVAPGATMLVVDDEDTVRVTTARMLEGMGHKTILAVDGCECIEKFRTRFHEISLVLLDLTMPHMDGEQTFHELCQIQPSVKVILMSGFTEKEAVSRFGGKRLTGFLQKPFTADQLNTVLTAALGPASGGSASPLGRS